MRCGELSPGQHRVQGASLPAPPQQEAPAPLAQSPGPGYHLDPSGRDRPSAQVQQEGRDPRAMQVTARDPAGRDSGTATAKHSLRVGILLLILASQGRPRLLKRGN